MSTVYTGDIWGRPRQIIIGSTIIAIAAIIQTASYGVAQMMVGRVIAGLGTGMNTATAGVWQAETSKMRSRGKLVVIQMANCITGFSVSNWLTLGFSFAPGSIAWRFPLAFQIFFTLCIYALCPFLPDSPRLLIRKGKHEEAYNVIAALQGVGVAADSASVKTQFNVIKDILDRENVAEYSWWDIIRGKGPRCMLRRLVSCLFDISIPQSSAFDSLCILLPRVLISTRLGLVGHLICLSKSPRSHFGSNMPC